MVGRKKEGIPILNFCTNCLEEEENGCPGDGKLIRAVPGRPQTPRMTAGLLHQCLPPEHPEFQWIVFTCESPGNKSGMVLMETTDKMVCHPVDSKYCRTRSRDKEHSDGLHSHERLWLRPRVYSQILL